MSKYFSIFRIKFTNSLQYRAAAFVGMITQFAWGFMLILAFSTFYKENPNAYPMEFSQTVSYIWMQQAFYSLFMMWYFENDIYSTITNGAIAYELARPIDLYNRWFCQAAAGRIARAVLRSMLIFVIAFIVPEPYRMSLPADLMQFILFLLSAALSVCVVVSFSMLIYISTFYMLSPIGIQLIATALSDFLSGATIPLPFFPEPFRQIVELLPFASMQNMPLRIYSGNIIGGDAAKGILVQVIWFALLVIIGKLLMKNAIRKVVVQGG